MDLTWVAVVIAGCLALAICVGVALLRPDDARRRRLRPLANVERLTALPEYVQAIRRRTSSTLAAVVLLLVAFAGAIIGGARPTGLPTATEESASTQPEDVMVCLGGPASDPAVGASLRYFASDVQTFGANRIGLTSANRRVVPLTRDYQYAAEQFGLARQGDGTDRLVAPVSYVDYAGGVADLLALCASGFPDTDQQVPVRRSIIYVGPDAALAADQRGPTLYDTDRVRDLAAAAGLQINAVIIGRQTDTLASLARDTDGQAFGADSDVPRLLDRIRSRPPAPTEAKAGQVSTQAVETPAIPILVALGAVALVGWLGVVGR